MEKSLVSHEEYLSKEVAAKRLGLGVRRLMELSQGKNSPLARHVEPNHMTGRDSVIFKKADVERYAKLREQSQLSPARERPLPRPPLALAPPPAPKLWLTVAEAAAESGLPA